MVRRLEGSDLYMLDIKLERILKGDRNTHGMKFATLVSLRGQSVGLSNPRRCDHPCHLALQLFS